MRNGHDCAIVVVIGVRMAFAGPFAPLKEHEKDDVTDLHRSVSLAVRYHGGVSHDLPGAVVGLAIFVAICYGAYYKTNNPVYLQMFRF